MLSCDVQEDYSFFFFLILEFLFFSSSLPSPKPLFLKGKGQSISIFSMVPGSWAWPSLAPPTSMMVSELWEAYPPLPALPVLSGPGFQSVVAMMRYRASLLPTIYGCSQ